MKTKKIYAVTAVSLAIIFLLGFVAMGIAFSQNAAAAAPSTEAKTTDLPKLKSLDELKKILTEMGALYDSKSTADFAAPEVAMDSVSEKSTSQSSAAPMPTNAPAVARGAANAPAADADASHSSTNTQVAGVDEGDIIKTDGKYVYYGIGNQVAIVAVNAAKMTRNSVLKLDENSTINEMYVSGDRLVTVSTRWEEPPQQPLGTTRNFIYYPGKEYTTYTIFDIKNRTAPVKVRALEIEGNPLSTRLVGNNLYYVTRSWINALPADYVDMPRILPAYSNITYAANVPTAKPATVDVTRISYFPGSRESAYMMVGAVDITKNESNEPKTYLGGGNYFYMNAENMFIACQDWKSSKTTTNIYKFSVTGTEVKYLSTGNVTGYPLNQYSMDMFEGNFRIATTDNAGGNGLYILGSDMKPLGSVTGLAKGEQIYSVRFMEKMCYLVTYKRVDPLFAIDLSDPKKPVVLGELKIPGFSQYLHPIGDGLLVGFGRNTTDIYYKDDNGKEVVVGQRDIGMKLSLFDVNDPKNPKEIKKLTIPGESVYSEVLNNPRAMMVDGNRNIFAFPLEIYDWNENSPEVNNFRGGYVVSVDKVKGFEQKAKLSSGNFSDGSEKFYYGATRLVYVGNTLYMAANGKLFAYDYTTFAKLADTATLFS